MLPKIKLTATKDDHLHWLKYESRILPESSAESSLVDTLLTWPIDKYPNYNTIWDDDVIVGFVTYKFGEHPGFMYIDVLYILKGYRGCGVGSAVIKALTEKPGFRKIQLHAFTTEAEGFFYWLGFTGQSGHKLTLTIYDKNS
jgi:hypothetical protein